MHFFTITSALRNIKNQPNITFLNIGGLTLGFVLTFMMVMLLHFELSFDKFHPQIESIYKIIKHDLKAGETAANTPMPLPKTLKNDFPEVENVASIWRIIGEDREILYNEIAYTGFTGASVEKDIFKVFAYELILGNPDNVFDTENKIVVSEKFAKTVFGDKNPVGEVINFDRFDFTISGLFKDLPNNSEVQFDILFSDKMRIKAWNQFDVAWWASGMQTYVKLKDGVSVEYFNKKLAKIPELYFPDFLKGRETYSAIPFKGIHFDDSINGGLKVATSPIYLYTLALIALLTLLIACFNFVNLSISSILTNGKVVGIRKVLGARSGQIITSQVIKAIIIATISLALAISFCYLLLPYFDYLTQRPISGQFGNPVIILIVFSIVLFVALITGYIPGLYFSKITTLKALSNKSLLTRSKAGFRTGFVVFQSSTTILLIIAQFVILKQIGFMQNTDLGFDKENLLVIGVSMIEEQNHKKKYEKVELYTRELEKYRAQYGFSKGTITENIPGFYYENSFTLLPVEGIIEECLVTSTAVGENFLDVYGIPMVEGRFFSGKIPSDRESFVINETLMKQIGWNTIEGKYMRYSQDTRNMPVIGVIKDIHTSTLKEPIGPMVYKYGQHNNSPAFITFRLTTSSPDKVLAFMNAEWIKLFPTAPFQPFYVKDKYLLNYIEEKRLAKITGNFTLFAILLSSIGLLGMFIFLLEQRVKEIGIRRVNGAKISEIFSLLNKDFIKWIALAFVIACPIAWYAMNKWLENFAYKTTMSWWVFVIAGVVASGISLLTVSWQSWRAATRNPVEALRYE